MLAHNNSVSRETHIHVYSYHVGAFGLEGVGAAGVEVCMVIALQETDVVEALGL